jgi:hypothetical protein
VRDPRRRSGAARRHAVAFAGEGSSIVRGWLNRRFAEGLDRLRRLPVWAQVLAGFAATALAIAVGIASFRAYEFVEHDNQFCLSCHLMVEPFERYTESGHDGLSCKACHQPSMIERTRMALTQVIEQPEFITEHAHVPNERCAACHIEGDPERWRVVAATAGHRVHFESREPELAGLQCVECHSSGIHEFVPITRTCAQSGCHENVDIVLGRMAYSPRLGPASTATELHCTLCHNFLVAPRGDAPLDTIRAALTPRQQDCTGCHEMDRLVRNTNLADDPHGGVCGACHNPHTQRNVRDAVQTCTAAGCHVTPMQDHPMHRGLASRALGQCLDCHSAHEWRARGDRCLDCHQDIFERERAAPPPGPRSGLSGGDVWAEPSRPVELAGMLPALWEALGPQQPQRPAAQPPPAQTRQAPTQTRQVPATQRGFSHLRHREVPCTRCHDTARTHGGLLVQTRRDCMQCHHVELAGARCSNCHRPAELRGRFMVPTSVRTSVAEPRTRALPFDHDRHRQVACAECHRRRPSLAVDVSCNACHTQHHERTRECRLCHTPSPMPAHDRDAHLGCAGAGCHQPAPIEVLRGLRTECLVCHQNQVLHEPGRECGACHL